MPARAAIPAGRVRRAGAAGAAVPVLSAIPGLAFDHDAALTRSAGIARQLTRAGLLSAEDCARAERLLAHRQHTPMISNNGDFYPRNLILRPGGRIVIIDWETWNPNSPFHTIDHPENVAAVFYVHMWGNPAWQAAYRAGLAERFAFSPALRSAQATAALAARRAIQPAPAKPLRHRGTPGRQREAAHVVPAGAKPADGLRESAWGNSRLVP